MDFYWARVFAEICQFYVDVLVVVSETFYTKSHQREKMTLIDRTSEIKMKSNVVY